ncbi:serine/threonine-protein kinase Nek2 [Pelomyxa schiedti]|nr:serine/threonine-protein kinase Nek2 [Pelomyxa schiedti]
MQPETTEGGFGVLMASLSRKAPTIPVDNKIKLEVYIGSANTLLRKLRGLPWYSSQSLSQPQPLTQSLYPPLQPQSVMGSSPRGRTTAPSVVVSTSVLPPHPNISSELRLTELCKVYILSFRFAKLVINTILQHHDHNSPIYAKDINNLRSEAKLIVEEIRKIKILIEQLFIGTCETYTEPQGAPYVPPTKPLPEEQQICLTDSPTTAQMVKRTGADFDLLAELGSGGFGTCRKMFDRKANRVTVVKSIHYTTVGDVKKIMREINALRCMSHPNIVQYFLTYLEPEHICICMEFCDGGDMGNWIKRRSSRLGHWTPVRDELIFRWAYEFCSGMEYIHRTGWLHRDLKPANVLLTSVENCALTDHENDQPHYSVRIADLGLSVDLESYSHASSNAGSMAYWAPEQYQGSLPSRRTDVYSGGCVLYEIMMGPSNPACALLVHDEKGTRDTKIHEFRCAYHPCASTTTATSTTTTATDSSVLTPTLKMCDVVLQMMDHEPKQRPTFASLMSTLNH